MNVLLLSQDVRVNDDRAAVSFDLRPDYFLKAVQ